MRTASAIALLVAAPGAAHAYCQQTTHRDDTCQDDPGAPISWPRHCMSYSIHEAGTPDVPFDVLRGAIRRSMDTWERATRFEEPAPCTDFGFTETETATCTRVEYSKDCGNVNLIIWRESEWQTHFGHDAAAIALSTIFFTGRADIVSTDMELNGENYTFAVQDDYTACGEDCPADVENTVTHEAGHLIGLSHVDCPACTMDYAEIPGDTNKRTLDPDDVEAICDIYPVGEAGASCDPTPPGGLDVACVRCDTGCCTTTPGLPRRTDLALFVAVVGLLGVVARRIR